MCFFRHRAILLYTRCEKVWRDAVRCDALCNEPSESEKEICMMWWHGIAYVKPLACLIRLAAIQKKKREAWKQRKTKRPTNGVRPRDVAELYLFSLRARGELSVERFYNALRKHTFQSQLNLSRPASCLKVFIFSVHSKMNGIWMEMWVASYFWGKSRCKRKKKLVTVQWETRGKGSERKRKITFWI